jgi:hypothetical protein
MEYANAVLAVLIPLAALFLAAMLKKNAKSIISALEAKTGLDVPEALEKKAELLVTAGVLKAEAWALAKTKQGAETPSGAKKLAAALEFVREEAEEHGLSGWVADKGESLADVVEEQVTKRLG